MRIAGSYSIANQFARITGPQVSSQQDIYEFCKEFVTPITFYDNCQTVEATVNNTGVFVMRFYRFLLVFILATLSFAILAPASAQDDTADTATDCRPSPPDGWVGYSVQRGDTLSEIAARTGSTVSELQRINCIHNARQIRVGQRLFVPHEPTPPENPFLRRCLNAGFTTQECRRIYNALHGENDHTFAERCLNAGYTTEQCRRIWNALHDDDHNLPERCRAAGLTIEECRRIVNDNAGDDVAARCRAAGLTPEECRRLYNDQTDQVTDRPERDQEQNRDRDRDQNSDQEPQQDRNRDRDQERDGTQNSTDQRR
jgi:LysM repeat protein